MYTFFFLAWEMHAAQRPHYRVPSRADHHKNDDQLDCQSDRVEDMGLKVDPEAFGRERKAKHRLDKFFLIRYAGVILATVP